MVTRIIKVEVRPSRGQFLVKVNTLHGESYKGLRLKWFSEQALAVAYADYLRANPIEWRA